MSYRKIKTDEWAKCYFSSPQKNTYCWKKYLKDYAYLGDYLANA